MAKKKSVWDRNFAESSKIRERVATYLIPKMRQTRDNRIRLEEEWMRYFYMWNVTKDDYHGYNGRANLYIPEVRKNVEAQARQMAEASFPNEDFFDVSPEMTGTKKGAEVWKSIQRWAVENAKLRVKALPFYRQEALLGTSPAYIPWTKREEMEFRSKKVKGKIVPIRSKVEIYNGPDFVVRDLFKWYSFNPKKQDILDDGCFEVYVANQIDLILKEKAGLLHGLNDILKGNSNAYMQDTLRRDVERAEAMGLQIQANVAYSGEATLKRDEDIESTHEVAMIFTKMVLPEACEEGEDPELPIPVKVEIYNNEYVGLVQRNPFFHQRPPYVVGKYILPNADEFYGQGIPKATQYMQYEINSKAEQCMDSVTYALNPIAIIDPGLAGPENDFNNEPGAKWLASPNGVKFAAMPDVSATGYAAIAQIRGHMQDYSDRSPALPPQLAGKARSATQAQAVEDIMATDNKTFQIQNEQMVLEEVLTQWESLIDQNITEDQIVMILGRRASDFKRILVPKEATLGRYRYFWKTTNITQNRAILSRQILDMIKVIGSLPPQAQQELKPQWGEIIKMLWTEGFGLPDGGKILGFGEEFKAQDAAVENKMIKIGLEVEALPGDDDQEHMKIHDAFMGQADKELQPQIMAHMLSHKKQLERKIQLMKQLQQQQALMMQMQEQQAQGSGTQGSGNRTQLSPNATVGNMASGVRA